MTDFAKFTVEPISNCGIGGASDFHTLWKLPKLPLTEMMGKYSKDFPSYDQELVVSLKTGHVQLRNRLPSHILYSQEDYAYRTGATPKSGRDLKVFVSFLEKQASDKKFKSLVDIGGNDLALAKLLKDKASVVSVVDPICASIDGQVVDGVHVSGKFIEKIDLRHDIERPDLVVCRHTLEHVSDPISFLKQLLEQCHEDCLYVFEVPCFDKLVEGRRFDAVFHQHYHYFGLDTFKYLLDEAGAEYLAHSDYQQGPCGGSLFVAFKKGRQKSVKVDGYKIEFKIKTIEESIRRYKVQMELLNEALESLPRPIYGYGAGLMLATLGYHLQTDFSMLECILDDDPTKNGATYKNVPVVVRSSSSIDIAPDSCFFVTSLENERVLLKKIFEMQPRRVLSPLVI